MEDSSGYDRFLSMYHGLELEPDVASYDKRGNENGVLYFVQTLKLKAALGTLEESDKFTFNQICDRMRTWKSDGTRYEGLFDRGADESKDKDRTIRVISNDNLTAISNFSANNDGKRAKEIAKHGLRNFMVYDNVYPESPRWYYIDRRNGKRKTRLQHPRDWFNWIYNGGGIPSILVLPLFPLFFMANVISCGSEYGETSGKLLAFTRLFGSKKLLYRLTWYFCRRRLIKTYGDNYLTEISKIYYKHPEHPVRVLAKEVDDKGLS